MAGIASGSAARHYSVAGYRLNSCIIYLGAKTSFATGAAFALPLLSACARTPPSCMLGFRASLAALDSFHLTLLSTTSFLPLLVFTDASGHCWSCNWCNCWALHSGGMDTDAQRCALPALLKATFKFEPPLLSLTRSEAGRQGLCLGHTKELTSHCCTCDPPPCLHEFKQLQWLPQSAWPETCPARARLGELAAPRARPPLSLHSCRAAPVYRLGRVHC